MVGTVISSVYSERTSGKISSDIMDIEELERIRQHLFERDYMSGVERDLARIKARGEVFTPKELVDQLLGEMNPSLFNDPSKTFVDPTCGDGEFLAGILFRKLSNGICFERALITLYGVDIMNDNVEECRRRLACGHSDEDVWKILKNNIRCADALNWFAQDSQGALTFD